MKCRGATNLTFQQLGPCGVVSQIVDIARPTLYGRTEALTVLMLGLTESSLFHSLFHRPSAANRTVEVMLSEVSLGLGMPNADMSLPHARKANQRREVHSPGLGVSASSHSKTELVKFWIASNAGLRERSAESRTTACCSRNNLLQWFANSHIALQRRQIAP